MHQARNPELLNLVAVLNPPAVLDIQVGDVGIVVELLPPDALEVEFLDRSGRTRSIATRTSWCLTAGGRLSAEYASPFP